MARCKQPSYSRNNTSTPYPLRPRGPAALQRQEPTVHIEDCDVRRGRTSPPDHCVQTPVTWRRTQSSITKYVPATEPSAHPRHLPASRGHRPREHAEQHARHAEDAPSGLRTASPGPVLSPKGVSSRFGRSGPPPPHMSGPSLSGPPRTPPAKCLPRLTRRPFPLLFPGIPESAAPQP